MGWRRLLCWVRGGVVLARSVMGEPWRCRPGLYVWLGECGVKTGGQSNDCLDHAGALGLIVETTEDPVTNASRPARCRRGRGFKVARGWRVVSKALVGLRSSVGENRGQERDGLDLVATLGSLFSFLASNSEVLLSPHR